jgi:transmembrane protein 33
MGYDKWTCWFVGHIPLNRLVNGLWQMNMLICRTYLEQPCTWVETNITAVHFLCSNAEILLGFLMIFSLFTLVDPIFYFSCPTPVSHLPSSSYYFSMFFLKKYYFSMFVGDNAMLCKHSCTGRLVPFRFTCF